MPIFETTKMTLLVNLFLAYMNTRKEYVRDLCSKFFHLDKEEEVLFLSHLCWERAWFDRLAQGEDGAVANVHHWQLFSLDLELGNNVTKSHLPLFFGWKIHQLRT